MPSKYNPDKHNRQSIRLQGYDYSQPGAYFITICTHNRAHFFGDIVAKTMNLNPLGQMAKQCWGDIPNHFPHVTLDEFIVMPNHVHGIITIVAGCDGTRRVANGVSVETGGGVQHFEPLRRPPHDDHPRQNKYQHIIPRSVGSIVRGFKIGVTKWARQNTGIHTVWQRNYHERIIRDERSLHRIRQYIKNNPMKWESNDLF